MNERAPIRDRTLVLRILVPRLEERLREKMRELEDLVSQKAAPVPSSKGSGSGSGGGGGQGGSSSSSQADSFWDLEGVSCEPTTSRFPTLWNFHCDGATYPAKLVNLPCPVEIHKTFDHAQYYKCQDVAQMLIVYEDDYALKEAEEKAMDGFPSYYHSGLTPPMKRVVERRFAAREHKAVAPPRSAVASVEEEILALMEQLQKDEKGAGGGGGNKRNKLPSLASTTKVLEEVEEVVMDYEPWMDDYGKQPDGVEFSIDDQLAKNHPELFLTPAEIRELREKDQEAQKEAQLEAQRKRAEAQEKKKIELMQLEKKEKKNKRNKKLDSKLPVTAAATATPLIPLEDITTTTATTTTTTTKPPVKKKGIASKKAAEKEKAAAEVAEKVVMEKTIMGEDLDDSLITQAAMGAINPDGFADDDDLFGDLGMDFDEEETPLPP